jgi:hypothetical protein
MKKEHFKTIAIACLIIFLFSMICLIISLNTTSADKLLLKDIATIFALIVSFVVGVISFVLSIVKKEEPKE